MTDPCVDYVVRKVLRGLDDPLIIPAEDEGDYTFEVVDDHDCHIAVAVGRVSEEGGRPLR